MDTKDRKRIGLLLENDDIGVIYYLKNIVATLSFLNDEEKPLIVLFYTKECAKHIQIFIYEYLEGYAIEKPSLLNGFFKSKLFNKNLFIRDIEESKKVEALFPVNLLPVSKSVIKLVSWIPDFQHKFFPHLFKKHNLLMRDFRFDNIMSNTSTLVLSSEDAYTHYKRFYKVKESLSVKILPFVSLMHEINFPEWSDVKNKYRIDRRYFLISNQFYVHKNHKIAIQAIKLLKERGFDFEIIMTGKTEDYRNKLFFPQLVKSIEAYNLSNDVRILGVIPRAEQLTLLKNSLAVIQPSKFEGWSTIIEDAKSLYQHVISSNIPVHVEQLGNHGFYFNSDSVEELADKMTLFLENKVSEPPKYESLEIRASRFAQQFMSIFDS